MSAQNLHWLRNIFFDIFQRKETALFSLQNQLRVKLTLWSKMRTINKQALCVKEQDNAVNWHDIHYTNKQHHSFSQTSVALTASIARKARGTHSGDRSLRRSKFLCGLIFGFPQQGLGVFRGWFANPHWMAERFGWTLTLQSSRHDILVQVVHVVRHEEVLRCCSAAHKGGVEVESWGQRGKAWVVDDGKTCEDLYLLPAMKPLPQSSSHLT